MSSSAPAKPPKAQETTARPQISLWETRFLLWALAKRDLQARYKNTILGWVWSILIPLGMLGIYWLIFSVIFRAVAPPMGDGEPGNYAVWVLVALVAWNIFANSVSMGLESVLTARPLLQKVYFPSYIATFSVTLGICVQATIEFGLVFVLLAIMGNIGWTWLLVPIIFVVFAIFSACVAYCLAIANTYLRDVGQAVPILVMMLFFLSAIIFPISMVPVYVGSVPLQAIMSLNPLAQFMGVFRDLMYGLQLPSLGTVLNLSLWTLAAIAACALVFRWRGHDVGEMT